MTLLPTLVQKYPLLGKMLAEQSALLRSLGTDVPEEVMSVQTRAFDAIDRLVAQDDAKKEAVMIVIVLANSPPFLYDDTARFGAEYSPLVRDVVEQLKAATYDDPLTPPLAQAKAAIGIAMLQETRAQVESGARSLTGPQALQIRERMNAQAPREEARTFANLDVPALRAAFDAEKQAMLDMIDDIVAAPFSARHVSFGPRRP